MKYKLRFFVAGSKSNNHVDADCICDLRSDHLPVKGNVVYLSDDIIKEKFAEKYVGVIFVVKYVVKVFDTQGLESAEVMLKETNI